MAGPPSSRPDNMPMPPAMPERQGAALGEALRHHAEHGRPKERLTAAVDRGRQDGENRITYEPTVGPMPSISRPQQPSTALQNSRPSGEILWTIGPAQKRSRNIRLEVQMEQHQAVALLARMVPVMLVIQLSVPSST